VSVDMWGRVVVELVLRRSVWWRRFWRGRVCLVLACGRQGGGEEDLMGVGVVISLSGAEGRSILRRRVLYSSSWAFSSSLLARARIVSRPQRPHRCFLTLSVLEVP